MPDELAWLVRRGDLLLSMGRPDQARKSFEAAQVALNALPKRLQASPSMVTLQTRINTAMSGLSAAPATARTD